MDRGNATHFRHTLTADESKGRRGSTFMPALDAGGMEEAMAAAGVSAGNKTGPRRVMFVGAQVG